MIKRNQARTIAFVLLLAFACAGCALPSPVPLEDGASSVASDFLPSGASSGSSSGTYAVDLTDMAGNAIQLSAYPERIVVLDPGDCEILYAIGAGASVNGRSLSCDYPTEALALPYATVDGRNDADMVLLREPQLVVMGAEDAADAELVSALSNAGIPMLVTNATDVNNLYGAISLLGQVTNHTAEANTLVSELITSIAALQTKMSEHTETVYLELTPLADGMTTLGGGNIFSALLAQLGYHNEFEDQQGLLQVTQDQVVGRSPDIILTSARADAASADSSTPDPFLTPDPSSTADPATPSLQGPAEILARAEWAQVDAVKNNRVYYFDPALITRAGPRIVEGINALYTALYESRQPEFS